MIIGEQKSNYPFTESSSMKLVDGVMLPPGTIMGALLYPRCKEDTIARVRKININLNTNSLDFTIVDQLDSYLCTAKFPRGLDEDVVPVGWAEQYGEFCGAICCRTSIPKEIYSVYFSSRLIGMDALVFSPSTFRPRRMFEDTPGHLVFNGKLLDSIGWNTSNESGLTLKDDKYTTIKTDKNTQEERVVSAITVNKTRMSGKHLCISTNSGSGIRVIVRENEIAVGRVADL